MSQREGGPKSVAERLASVKSRIAEAAAGSGKLVHLVAVTKAHGPEVIIPAIDAGHRLFGENRVQEAERKWPQLRVMAGDLKLHLIGPLQTNKVRSAVALFDGVQSLDRIKLASALAKEMDRQRRRLDLFVQVNTGEEPQKAGIAPHNTVAFVRQCREDFGLTILGLMCIPPLARPPEPHFQMLRALGEECGVSEFSMGMSADFESAIRMGATYIRVGAAIFGERR